MLHFNEVALFTERAVKGRMFLLLSKTLKEFDIINATSLQHSGAFSNAFNQKSSTLFPCYALHSNTLLIQQTAFYVAGRTDLSLYCYETGADWLVTYRAIKDRLYGMYFTKALSVLRMD